MKILQINNSFRKVGGAESVFLNTIDLLRKRGHQVVPFSLHSSLNLNSEFSEYFVKDVKPLHNKLYSFAAQKKIAELIKKEKPDIAHIHNIVGGLTFAILPVLKKMGIPVVASIHDFRLLCPAFIFINGKNEICERCKNGRFFNCLTNNCSPEGIIRSGLLTIESYFRNIIIPFDEYINKFIFVSNFTMNKFFETKYKIKSKSYQLYNFTSDFDYDDIKSDNKYFLFIGRLSREKGLLSLIEAFKELPEQNLIIAGEGPLKKELFETKSPNIEFIGHKSGVELKELIKKAYFIIISSECFENNPMAIVESYSVGTPVIGSDLGGIPEIIIDGETGYLFKNKNVLSLMGVIKKAALINKKEYSNMSYNAYNFAQKKFSASNHFDALSIIYQNAIEDFFQ